jgi:hypothetical protein
MPKNKYIETPAVMWDLFCAYKTQTKETPIKKHVFVGKDGDSADEKRERPLTIEGFENYVADLDIIQDLGDYFENRNKGYSDYIPVCRRIKRVIRQDQIEGGMAMIYHPSITQRLNGLVDKKEESGDINIKVSYATKANYTGGTAPESSENISGAETL